MPFSSATLAIILAVVIIALFISGVVTPGMAGCIAALSMSMLLPELDLSNVYSGFGGNTITMCAGMCVVSDALFYTGVGPKIGAKISSTPLVSSERVFCAAVAAICTVQSAFMSNNGTCAMWMALIATIATGSNGRIRSKMAIFPAATGCIVGGGSTLVGSTAQAVGNGLLQQMPGFESGMAVFDMTMLAWPACIVQIIFWLTIGYDIMVKVMKPDSPNFDEGNAYATPPAMPEHGVPAWKGTVAVVVLFGSIVCFILSGFAPFNNYMNIGTIPVMAATILFALRVVPVHKTLAGLPWDTIITIGTISILGTGLTETGAGDLIAGTILGLVGSDVSPQMLLIVFMLLGGFLTLFLQNAGTIAMLVPIAAPLATSMGVSPAPFVIALCVSCNMAIATPLGTAVNTQILPVGYKFKDFVLIGGPCWVLIMITLCITSSLIYF